MNPGFVLIYSWTDPDPGAAQWGQRIRPNLSRKPLPLATETGKRPRGLEKSSAILHFIPLSSLLDPWAASGHLTPPSPSMRRWGPSADHLPTPNEGVGPPQLSWRGLGNILETGLAPVRSGRCCKSLGLEAQP